MDVVGWEGSREKGWSGPVGGGAATDGGGTAEVSPGITAPSRCPDPEKGFIGGGVYDESIL